MRHWAGTLQVLRRLSSSEIHLEQLDSFVLQMAAATSKLAQGGFPNTSTNLRECGQFTHQPRFAGGASQAESTFLHPGRPHGTSRLWLLFNRQHSGSVQHDGSIDCVCSAHLHQGGPLPPSHMLAPRPQPGTEPLTERASYEQITVCRAARLRHMTQVALGARRAVRQRRLVQASSAGSSPVEEESEDLGHWPWLEKAKEVTHNGSSNPALNLVRTRVSIHPTAVVHDDAVLGKGVSIGPLCTVGPGAVLGEGCIMHPGSHVAGNTHMGERNVILSGATIGADLPGTTIVGDDNSFGYSCVVGVLCQDLKYKGDDCYLVIGNKNDVREHVSIHRSSKPHLKTIIGDNNLIMGSCHLAHDCLIGNHNIMANGTLLAGHVVIHDHVHTGGATAVHQFCHLGSYAFLAGGAMVDRDVPTFTIVHGDRAEMRGLNFEGLRRAGFKTSQVDALRKTYEKLFMSVDPPGLEDRLAIVEANEALAGDKLAQQLISFIKESTSSTSKRRGICKFRHWTDR